MSKYDKELQTGTDEYEEAMKPEREAREKAKREGDEAPPKEGEFIDEANSPRQ